MLTLLWPSQAEQLRGELRLAAEATAECRQELKASEDSAAAGAAEREVREARCDPLPSDSASPTLL